VTSIKRRVDGTRVHLTLMPKGGEE
jgi:hypothetical protein